MRIDYVRVSTDDQSLDLQLDALKKAGCRRVFTDKASAANREWPGLAVGGCKRRMTPGKIESARMRLKGGDGTSRRRAQSRRLDPDTLPLDPGSELMSP